MDAVSVVYNEFKELPQPYPDDIEDIRMWLAEIERVVMFKSIEREIDEEKKNKNN